jgi:hypothetical protein
MTQQPKRKLFKIFSDTVTGFNVRKKDNLLQLLVMIITTIIVVLWTQAGFPDSAFSSLFDSRYSLLVAGAIIGLLLGLVIGGALIAFYPLYRHSQGRHD